MSIFKRLLREAGQSREGGTVDIDELSPHLADQTLYQVSRSHAPMSVHDRGVTIFHGNIANPYNPSPPRPLATDSPPPIATSHEIRSHRGEGLFGIEPIVPPGSTT